MNKSVFYIVFFLAPFVLQAQQNLVPNGSFEEAITCPLGILDFTPAYWTQPTWGSSDYFNSCNFTNVSTPSNFSGYQAAQDGGAYCGFASCFESPNPETREYLQVELLSPLEEGKEYVFQAYICLSELSKYCNKGIGVALSDSPIGGSYIQAIPLQPQIILSENVYCCDTTNWVKVSGVYNANGGETYLTIGLFLSDSQADTYVFNPAGSAFCAYYLIDNVSLTEFMFPEIPNIFTPNNDGLNDKWEFALSNECDVTIVDRWGNVIIQTTINNNIMEWDGTTLNGLLCNDGNYFFSIKKGEQQKTGFIQLIR